MKIRLKDTRLKQSQSHFGYNHQDVDTRLSWIWLVSIAWLFAACLGRASALRGEGELVRFEDSRISMACTYTIVVYGHKSQPLARIVSAALDEVDRLKNRALSISGDSEKFFESGGARYSHIMDPRTGWPVHNMLAVAVLTDSGTAGDALDNVFFVQSIEKSRALLARLPETDVFLFLPKASKGWKVVHLKGAQPK